MQNLFQDLRFGLRMLCKFPGFTFITTVILALGVAGNVIIFTAYNALYLRPFPFFEPSRLMDLNETAPRWNLEYTGLAYPDFCGWREHNRSFEGMAAWVLTTDNLSFDENLERVRGAKVTYDFASVLGIKPILGRSFTREEDRPGGAKVLMLGNGFWKRQFGGREDVAGKTLTLNQEPFTIVGVLPPDKDMLVEAEYWIPLGMDPNDLGRGWFLNGIGRLKQGVSASMAQDDLRRVHAGLVENRRANENTAPRLTSLSDRYFGDMRLVLRVMLGAVVVVLIIACGNVAALMLARGLARSRELALRLSLGASMRRLARLIGLESLLLAGLGGLAGVALGYWGLHTLLNTIPTTPPRWVNFDMDWRIWLFVASIVGVSALLGALPVARSASKLDLHGTLKSSALQSTAAGAGQRNLRALVVGELALTLILTIQACLLVQTFRALQKSDPGFRSGRLLLYEIALPGNKYPSNEVRLAFFQDHVERVRRLPGVESASAANLPPLSGHTGTFFTIENAPPPGPNEPRPVVLRRVVCPGYFDTMGIPILAGRSFTEQDGRNQGSQVVIVDEAFAKRSWPNDNPIGKRIRNTDDAPWLTVVGVARDVKHYGLDQVGHPGIYLPFAQDVQGQMVVVVRSLAAPSSLVSSIRTLVRQNDPDLPVFGVTTMEEKLSQSMWSRRLSASLFEIFSGVALMMAVGGIYGVFSYIVSRRTQEIGVRLALGAPRRDVLWLVLRQGLTLAAIGIGVGLTGALMATPVTRKMLYGVSPVDPLTICGVIVLLVVVAALACWIPALRAMRIEPMTALRSE